MCDVDLRLQVADCATIPRMAQTSADCASKQSIYDCGHSMVTANDVKQKAEKAKSKGIPHTHLRCISRCPYGFSKSVAL